MKNYANSSVSFLEMKYTFRMLGNAKSQHVAKDFVNVELSILKSKSSKVHNNIFRLVTT